MIKIPGSYNLKQQKPNFDEREGDCGQTIQDSWAQCWAPEKEDERQETGDRRQETEDVRQETGDRRRETGDNRQGR